MTPEVKEALDKSIKHWEENLERTSDDRSGEMEMFADSCALCVLIMGKNGMYRGCAGCPVAERSGNKSCGCYGTPWEVLHDALYEGDPEKPPTNEQIVEMVSNQLEFLKSLRED